MGQRNGGKGHLVDEIPFGTVFTGIRLREDRPLTQDSVPDSDVGSGCGLG